MKAPRSLAFIALAALALPARAEPASEDFLKMTRWGAPQNCTSAKSVAVSFRYVEKNADRRAGRCVRMTGYLWGETLYMSAALARDKGAEPDWRSVGLNADWRRYPALTKRLARVSVTGIMADCGSSNIPHYCHYVGGSIIYVATIKRIG
jgi:hypothetical protein